MKSFYAFLLLAVVACSENTTTKPEPDKDVAPTDPVACASLSGDFDVPTTVYGGETSFCRNLSEALNRSDTSARLHIARNPDGTFSVWDVSHDGLRLTFTLDEPACVLRRSEQTPVALTNGTTHETAAHLEVAIETTITATDQGIRIENLEKVTADAEVEGVPCSLSSSTEATRQ